MSRRFERVYIYSGFSTISSFSVDGKVLNRRKYLLDKMGRARIDVDVVESLIERSEVANILRMSLWLARIVGSRFLTALANLLRQGHHTRNIKEPKERPLIKYFLKTRIAGTRRFRYLHTL